MLENKNITGAKRGTAIHYVMQKYNPLGEVLSEGVKDFIESLVQQGELTADEAKAVDPDMIADFYKSDLGKRILKSPRVVREAPFEIEVDANKITNSESREKILIQGVIDCYFYEDDEIVIVDYKSDYYNNVVDFIQKYTTQIEYYSKAIEKICKKTVKNKYIYSFFTKNVLEC